MLAQLDLGQCTVVPYRYQPNVDVPGPIYVKNGTTPTDTEVSGLVAQAHAQGLQVMLRPCVDPVRPAYITA
jgi:hypothetical protein